MNIKPLESKIKPVLKTENLTLHGQELLDLRTLNANIIVDILEAEIKKRESLLRRLNQ